MDPVNSLFDPYRERLLSGQSVWTAVTLALVAWRGPYSFLETNRTVQDVADGGGALVQVSMQLLHPQVITGGYARTDTALFPNVPAGEPVLFLTMIEVGATIPASLLVCYIDTADGLPFTPNGQDQPVQPDWIQHRGWLQP
jgi:hypothetical protein